MTVDELKKKYIALCHAMQSGVAAYMNYDEKETAPKHLRVGVNSSLVDSSALANLLMRKGYITGQEYYESLVAQMQDEVKSYEDRLSQLTGAEIKLG